MLERIVSGGQTGVDRGALDAALERGMPIGGWVPKGRVAEDGCVPVRYAGLREAPRSGYSWRTEHNVLDSDATLILAPDPARLSPGTKKTLALALRHGKPVRLSALVAGFPDLPETVAWVEDTGVNILNVAGPRESKFSGAQELACGYVGALLDRLAAAAGPELLPEVSEPARFTMYLPFYTLKAACGRFGDGEDVECSGWIRAEVPGGRRWTSEHFVVRASGHSMEPMIPDGAFCVFRAAPDGFGQLAGSRQNMIVLAQHADVSDPDTGGAYSIKRYSSTKASAPDADWVHESITLNPLNRDYPPIEIFPDRAGSFRIVAEFVSIL